jgi:hypothetical protein
MFTVPILKKLLELTRIGQKVSVCLLVLQKLVVGRTILSDMLFMKTNLI